MNTNQLQPIPNRDNQTERKKYTKFFFFFHPTNVHTLDQSFIDTSDDDNTIEKGVIKNRRQVEGVESSTRRKRKEGRMNRRNVSTQDAHHSLTPERGLPTMLK
jgi:hypothetical protein